MTEQIVYLPRGSQGATSQLVSLKAEDVFNALDSAGIKWILESLDEFKVRMLQTQVDELRKLLQEINGQREELVDTVRRVVGENERLKQETHSQKGVMAATIKLLEDENKRLRGEIHFLKGGKGKEIQE